MVHGSRLLAHASSLEPQGSWLMAKKKIGARARGLRDPAPKLNKNPLGTPSWENKLGLRRFHAPSWIVYRTLPTGRTSFQTRQGQGDVSSKHTFP